MSARDEEACGEQDKESQTQTNGSNERVRPIIPRSCANEGNPCWLVSGQVPLLIPVVVNSSSVVIIFLWKIRKSSETRHQSVTMMSVST